MVMRIGDSPGQGGKLYRAEITNISVNGNVCDTTTPLHGKRDFTVTWDNLCSDHAIVGGYPANQQQASDYKCTPSTGTFTGHPQWVVFNECFTLHGRKDLAVWTGKSFSQCHTVNDANGLILRLHGQPARYKIPATCPA